MRLLRLIARARRWGAEQRRWISDLNREIDKATAAARERRHLGGLSNEEIDRRL